MEACSAAAACGRLSVALCFTTLVVGLEEDKVEKDEGRRQRCVRQHGQPNQRHACQGAAVAAAVHASLRVMLFGMHISL